MPIHPTAIVEDGARLGAGVDVGPFCFVGKSVALGDGVRLISHISVQGVTDVGARTVIHPGAMLGGEAQIRGDDAQGARLTIGQDCVIREHVTMSLGSARGGGVTSVGARGYFMGYSHIGHDCHVGDGATFANGAQLGGHVELGEGVIMGGLSAVQQFGRVGRGAMIGGITGVNTDVIPFGIAAGDHAELGGLNLVGLKRRGLPRESINAMRAAYRFIFLGESGSLADRARRARERWSEIGEVLEIADFILAPAKRPICLARRRPDAHENA
ncbi:MAG: acyl-ACP--UDP-N-acetylglucosamine O-acyltransferase [Alphaproteobacteria bacterium]|nr:acyl-ACP--UDP-N-acetylglucosamine O-acyltransferase [Alphaproteobacteria bacterium]MBV9694914.1 acyl-ACP--UDP-N-acetylglucosamine O-acyltransferase [Alphaproteobacteria bacterium]